jgi:hypothetical protein
MMEARIVRGKVWEDDLGSDEGICWLPGRYIARYDRKLWREYLQQEKLLRRSGAERVAEEKGRKIEVEGNREKVRRGGWRWENRSRTAAQ